MFCKQLNRKHQSIINNRAKEKDAFTLIELLVVIAIIALLLSIMLPALYKAKAQAQRIYCSSHLHGLGIAVAAYLVDNDSTYRYIPNHGQWIDEVTRQELSPTDDNAYWGIAYSYYADNKEIFHCPSAVKVDW